MLFAVIHMVYGCIHRCTSDALGSNREHARHVADFVVALNFLAAGSDCVGSNSLTVGSGHGVRHGISANGAFYAGGQLGIGRAVGLALIVRRHGHILVVLDGDYRSHSRGCGNRGHLGSIAGNGNGFLGDFFADGGAGHNLVLINLVSVPDIVHRVVGHIQLELGGEGGVRKQIAVLIQVRLYSGQI